MRAYDVREVAGFADYFLVCSGTSDRHVTAVSEHIDESIRKGMRMLPVGTEGMRQGRWSLIDYGDVVVHVFLESVREFYRFDHLWGAAPRVELPEEEPPAAE